MANTRGEDSPGEVVCEARVATGSPREFAKNLDITPPYMRDIGNDRRTSAEDALKKIADLLKLNFDDLMAQSGRFGDDTERYMRRYSTAGILFRQISKSKLSDDDLVKLFKNPEEMGQKQDQDQ